MAAVIDEARNKLLLKATNIPMLHIHHAEHNLPIEDGYVKLAKHFKYALNQAFHPPEALKLSSEVKRVLILEEDLIIAPDFFEYFTAISPLLDRDDTLLCASAWNDNGLVNKVKDEKVIVRSDFFPGLGWMLTKRVWTELEPKWPKAYWDDWLREPAQRKERQILRPEICRTYHIGRKGVSKGQFSNFLTQIQLNTAFVPFSSMDLSYLFLDKYEAMFLTSVRKATLTTMQSFRQLQGVKEVRVVYPDLKSFPRFADWAGVMPDVKAGVPRGAYRGIVTCYLDGVKVYLVPASFS